jgi:hypothetical protein
MDQIYFPCTFEVWDAEHENLIITGEGEIHYRTEVETIKISKRRSSKFTRMLWNFFDIDDDVWDEVEEMEIASYLLYPGRSTPSVSLKIAPGSKLENFFNNSFDAMMNHDLFSPVTYRRKIIAKTPHEMVTVHDTFPQSVEPVGDVVIVDVSGWFTLDPLPLTA